MPTYLDDYAVNIAILGRNASRETHCWNVSFSRIISRRLEGSQHGHNDFEGKTYTHPNTIGIIHSHKLFIARPMPIVELEDAEVKKSMTARSCEMQTHPT